MSLKSKMAGGPVCLGLACVYVVWVCVTCPWGDPALMLTQVAITAVAAAELGF